MSLSQAYNEPGRAMPIVEPEPVVGQPTEISAEPMRNAPIDQSDEKKLDVEHVENEHIEIRRGSDGEETIVDPHGGHTDAGKAYMNQRTFIPTTGKRKVTTKWEYIFFCMFYFSNNGAPIGSNGGPLRQALTNQQFPSNFVTWGSQKNLTITAFILDMTGIQFALQLVVLLVLGPYADYGTWRPWILISSQTLLYCMQFAMIGMKEPSQWLTANGIYLVGTLAANISVAFYQATFPSIVRDLPKMMESEKEVKAGTKTAEAHAKMDSYERSQLYNLCNITGSALVVIFYAIAVGISAGIGYSTNAQLIYTYRVLMGYFGAITVICTVPFFIVQKHRPGQQLPKGTNWLLVGPKQVWSAAKSAWQLRQCLMYLFAFFMVNETFGTYFSVVGTLQAEVIHYSPLLNNAMSLCADLGGGSGTVFMYFLQKKYRFSVKAGCFYGACMTLIPSFWGGIGLFTNAIGFHHVWEFWLAQFWNFQTAAWGAYQVTMISEVVPGPKVFLFFALFNTVSKTSGFIGPFISAAIIERAGGNNNACFWFLFAMGSCGAIMIYFIDTDKAKIDNARFLEREAAEYYTDEQRLRAQEDDNENEKPAVVS